MPAWQRIDFPDSSMKQVDGLKRIIWTWRRKPVAKPDAHLSAPGNTFWRVKEHPQTHAVFGQEWLESPGEIELDRIQIPQEKTCFPATDRHGKYAFDLLLLPVGIIFARRRLRAKSGVHIVEHLTTPRRTRRGLHPATH